MYIKIGKRLLDILLAGGFLIILSPVFFVLIFILFFYNRGKIFFIQTRIGIKNKPFRILKFKTMNEAKDENNLLVPDEKRISVFGFFLRKYSLDELPQLINILLGDMSVVGPRPLLPEYLSYYNQTQLQRHNVLPGITGLAQINGRNDLGWEERFNWDIKYAKEISFKLDIKILLITFKKLLTSSEIHGDVISKKFTDYLAEVK